MHFLDEVVFELGKFFDAFALHAQLIQKDVLLGRKPVHPPETDSIANGAHQCHPKSEAVFIHDSGGNRSDQAQIPRITRNDSEPPDVGGSYFIRELKQWSTGRCSR
jgi:hypothetical protein